MKRTQSYEDTDRQNNSCTGMFEWPGGGADLPQHLRKQKKKPKN